MPLEDKWDEDEGKLTYAGTSEELERDALMLCAPLSRTMVAGFMR